MKQGMIPKTDLRVSPICLGTMTYGTPVAEPEAIKLTHWALDHGVNFIDTANIYEGYTRVIGSAGGVSEEILGQALKSRREQAVLATKVGMKVGDGPEDEGASRAAIENNLDRSLKRLQTDYVDIYYLHKPDEQVPLTETLGALAAAMEAGKIRHYGISNYSAAQMAELLETADANGLPRPVIHQPPFSLLKRDVEKDLLPLWAREQVAVAPYQVLQGGMLTGKYRRGQAPPEGSRQVEKPQWGVAADQMETVMDQVEELEAQARAEGKSLLAYTLQTTLALPGMVSLVLGVKRIDQVESLIAAMDA